MVPPLKSTTIIRMFFNHIIIQSHKRDAFWYFIARTMWFEKCKCVLILKWQFFSCKKKECLYISYHYITSAHCIFWSTMCMNPNVENFHTYAKMLSGKSTPAKCQSYKIYGAKDHIDWKNFSLVETFFLLHVHG